MSNILHVDSYDAARNRICSMKINFSGPKKNFFIESKLTENERHDEKRREQIFKQKK